MSRWLMLLFSLYALVFSPNCIVTAAEKSPSPSSSSSTPEIPRTAASPAASSPASTSEKPKKRAKRNKEAENSQQCFNNGNQKILNDILGAQCPLPVDDETTGTLAELWSPWTHPPSCTAAKETYCVYTKANFRDGVSVIATPGTAADVAAVLERIAAASTASAHRKGSRTIQDSGLLDLREVPGKDLGVIAMQHIPRGTVLLVDNARILAEVQFPKRVRRMLGRQLLHKGADRLPDPGDVRSLSRSGKIKQNEFPGVLEEDIISTNSFAAIINDVEYMALFPQVARINHACHPSAVTRFNKQDLTQSVMAFRDIEPGEEITISYTEFGLTHKERQEKLLRHWGFNCTCDLCRGGAEATDASDRRRQRVAAIRGEVVALLQKGEFGGAIRTYEGELLDLVRTEQLAEHLGEHYEVLARMHLASGNRTGAGRYAQLALDEMEMFGGAEVYASVAELRSFLEALKRNGENKGSGTKERQPQQQKKKKNNMQSQRADRKSKPHGTGKAEKESGNK